MLYEWYYHKYSIVDRSQKRSPLIIIESMHSRMPYVRSPIWWLIGIRCPVLDRNISGWPSIHSSGWLITCLLLYYPLIYNEVTVMKTTTKSLSRKSWKNELLTIQKQAFFLYMWQFCWISLSNNMYEFINMLKVIDNIWLFPYYNWPGRLRYQLVSAAPMTVFKSNDCSCRLLFQQLLQHSQHCSSRGRPTRWHSSSLWPPSTSITVLVSIVHADNSSK